MEQELQSNDEMTTEVIVTEKEAPAKKLIKQLGIAERVCIGIMVLQGFIGGWLILMAWAHSSGTNFLIEIIPSVSIIAAMFAVYVFYLLLSGVKELVTYNYLSSQNAEQEETETERLN